MNTKSIYHFKILVNSDNDSNNISACPKHQALLLNQALLLGTSECHNPMKQHLYGRGYFFFTLLLSFTLGYLIIAPDLLIAPARAIMGINNQAYLNKK